MKTTWIMCLPHHWVIKGYLENLSPKKKRYLDHGLAMLLKKEHTVQTNHCGSSVYILAFEPQKQLSKYRQPHFYRKWKYCILFYFLVLFFFLFVLFYTSILLFVIFVLLYYCLYFLFLLILLYFIWCWPANLNGETWSLKIHIVLNEAGLQPPLWVDQKIEATWSLVGCPLITLALPFQKGWCVIGIWKDLIGVSCCNCIYSPSLFILAASLVIWNLV